MEQVYHVSPPFPELASYLGTLFKGEATLVRKSPCPAQLLSGYFLLSVPPLTPLGFTFLIPPPHPCFSDKKDMFGYEPTCLSLGLKAHVLSSPGFQNMSMKPHPRNAPLGAHILLSPAQVHIRGAPGEVTPAFCPGMLPQDTMKFWML